MTILKTAARETSDGFKREESDDVKISRFASVQRFK